MKNISLRHIAIACDAFAQGNQGYVQDLLIALQKWEFTPETTRVPVSLWYGELDMSTVHSPDFGKY